MKPYRPRTRPLLNRVLDGFATKAGLFLTLGTLFTMCLAAGIYFQRAMQQTEAVHEIFKDRQLRNGFVSMSDLQRLNLIALRSARAGLVSAQDEKDFSTAADILYVRLESFRRVLDGREDLPDARNAIRGLERVLAIADGAIASGFAGSPDALADALLIASDEARQWLVIYLDEMRRLQDVVLDDQSRALNQQHLVVWFNLLVLTLFGAVMLLLLRREVLARHARREAEERAAFLAYFDSLTGLPNRIQFQDRIEEMMEAGAPMTLLLADLDDFKAINDTHGHSAGDAVLKYVAGIIDRVAREAGGFAARLGGDEFAAAIPGDDAIGLTRVCQKISEAVTQELYFDREALSTSTSMGLATTTQLAAQMASNFDTLTRVADFALYAAKDLGRNCYAFYDEELEIRFLKRRALLTELPGAIAQGDLRVYLQPKVRLKDGEVYGFEALVRWQRGDEMVPPSDFVALAEEAGLINEIDLYVLRETACKLGRWNAEHGNAISFSANLSTMNFSSPRIVREVGDVLEESGLAPELLTLEITETLEIRDWDNARRIIDALHELGCKIAIDDFGTGFSSLAYLRAAAADELKIDKSLVDEIDTSEEARFIVDAVVEIADSLQMAVTVEGIESAEQAQIVHGMGARNGQGYHFGRPVPIDTALDALTPPHEAWPSAAVAGGPRPA